MKRIICVSLAAFICLISLVSCGAATDNGLMYESEFYSQTLNTGGSDNKLVYVDAEEDFAMDMVESPTMEAPYEPAEKQKDALAGRKIVYSSNYVIHTKEYDASVAALDSLCQRTGAYFENKNAYGGEDGRERRSNYTIRVPVENYKEFISNTGSIGTLISSSENNRDITEQYYDSEARLESALIREERVLEILKNASKLDDVLALERELSDIRYEIENLTGTLRKYDSLVNYCTVTMEIRETSEAVREPAKVLTFGERVSKGFNSGISNFTSGVQNFVIFLSYNIIGIAFWAIVIVVAIIIFARKNKKRKAKRVQKTPEAIKPETENKN